MKISDEFKSFNIVSTHYLNKRNSNVTNTKLSLQNVLRSSFLFIFIQSKFFAPNNFSRKLLFPEILRWHSVSLFSACAKYLIIQNIYLYFRIIGDET